MAFERQLSQVNANVFIIVHRFGELFIAIDALKTRILVRQHMHTNLSNNLHTKRNHQFTLRKTEIRGTMRAYLATNLTLKLFWTQLHMFNTDMPTHSSFALERDRTFGALEDFVPKVFLSVLRIATKIGTLLLTDFTFNGTAVSLLHMTPQIGLNTETLLAHRALVQQLLW